MAAFGKDRSTLQAVTPFGGNTSLSQKSSFLLNRQQETRQRSGGGGARFSDIYKPTTTGMDEIRIIPGAFAFKVADEKKNIIDMTLEYWPYIEHFDGKNKRSSICSGGIYHNSKKDRDACHGCDLFFGTMQKENGKNKSRVSKRDMFVFNVLHYHPYHKIEQVDRNTGKVKTNDDNQPYYEWVQCEGRTCEMCKAQCETVPYKVQKWEMGISHFKTLTQEYDVLIGRSCKSCKNKDSIGTVAWLCPNDKCGEAVIDMATTTLSDEEINNIKNENAVCPSCRQAGMLIELVECAKCGTPTRSSIFDVNLKVKRMEVSKDGGNQTQLMISGWSDPCELDSEVAAVVSKSMFDLSKIYVPTPLETQAVIFEVGSQTGAAVRPQGGFANRSLSRTPVNSGAPAVNSGFRAYGASAVAGGAATGPNYTK